PGQPRPVSVTEDKSPNTTDTAALAAYTKPCPVALSAAGRLSPTRHGGGPTARAHCQHKPVACIRNLAALQHNLWCGAHSRLYCSYIPALPDNSLGKRIKKYADIRCPSLSGLEAAR